MTSRPGYFPAPPWRLKGEAFLQLQLIDLARARAWVPPELGLIPVLPGKTLGGLYYASYTLGSTLQYHELIVVAGLVRHRLSLGGWVSHIYVDSPESVAGGREIWSLPKEPARFSGSHDELTISQDETRLCILRRHSPKLRLPVPLFAPVISKGEQGPRWFRGLGSARCGVGSGTFAIPSESPFAALGLGQGVSISMDRLNLLMRAPG